LFQTSYHQVMTTESLDERRGKNHSGSDPTEVIADIVARSRDAVFRYQLEAPVGYLYVSPAITGLTGYTPEDYYADPLLHLKLVHPDDRPLLEALMAAPEVIQGLPIVRFMRKDGRLVWTEPVVTVVRHPSGAPRWADAVVRDVTRREEDARRLELVKQRARSSEPEPGRPIRVLVVDDHELTRAGLVAILARDSDLEIAGEANNGFTALRLAQQLEPDLVLMDIRMPEMDGLEATRRLKDVCPMTSVLLLSMFDDPDMLVQAIKAGGAGYVLKDSSLGDIQRAIREVASGGFPVDHRLAREILGRLAQESSSPGNPEVNPLSSRELEVLGLLAGGATNREIGEALTITSHTVKGHVEHILAKLGVSDRTQAAVRAIELGLFTSGP
jgi:PAS domain S-box-containing protein